MQNNNISKKDNYHYCIILLHWIMALAIFLMLISGVIMQYFDIDKSLKFNLYQYHKSLGILLLISFIIRVFCRIFTYIPPLPKKFSILEKNLAKLGHYLLYILIFLMVFSGWIMVSSSIYGIPTIVFGWFEWPHLAIAGNQYLNQLAKLIHFISAIILFFAIIGHILAVIKHRIKDNEKLIKRIWFTK
jgi:cytochrome b561